MGDTSGELFVEALDHCGSAPTRTCILDYVHGLTNYTANGLLGGTDIHGCTVDNYNGSGNWCWKWIFDKSVAVTVKGTAASLDSWVRLPHPSKGFLNDTLHCVRGDLAGQDCEKR